MQELLKRNRSRINEELPSSGQRKYSSAALFAHNVVTEPAVCMYPRGKLIDIGCGDMPFHLLIENLVTQYDSIDIERRISGVRYIGDIQDMNMIDDDSFITRQQGVTQ